MECDMTVNLKALLESATPLTRERATELIDADIAANAHRYAPPAPTSIALDCESESEDELGGSDDSAERGMPTPEGDLSNP